MQKWFTEFIKEAEEETHKRIGNIEGRLEAYKAISKKLDPDFTCQECGHEYRTWGPDEQRVAVSYSILPTVSCKNSEDCQKLWWILK